jgi:hypothetical protein
MLPQRPVMVSVVLKKNKWFGHRLHEANLLWQEAPDVLFWPTAGL